MKLLKGMLLRSEEVQDLVKFLWKMKLWFLIPFMLVMIILAMILFFAQSTGVAPFIYTLI